MRDVSGLSSFTETLSLGLDEGGHTRLPIISTRLDQDHNIRTPGSLHLQLKRAALSRTSLVHYYTKVKMEDGEQAHSELFEVSVSGILP
jgi:hypothetical protein